MHLTRYTDNALRCLTLLALERDAETPMTVADIARRMRMSEAHLFKVVGRLAALGLVSATRGRGGGVRLIVDPGEVRVGAVVRATEETFALVECFSPEDNQCPIAPACTLATALDHALAAFLAELDRVTLADLVQQRRRLARLIPT